MINFSRVRAALRESAAGGVAKSHQLKFRRICVISRVGNPFRFPADGQSLERTQQRVRVILLN